MNVRDGFFMLEGIRLAFKEMLKGFEIPEAILAEAASTIFGEWAEEHDLEELRGTEDDMWDAYLDFLNATKK